jgi:hypothetical protein
MPRVSMQLLIPLFLLLLYASNFEYRSEKHKLIAEEEVENTKDLRIA